MSNNRMTDTGTLLGAVLVGGMVLLLSGLAGYSSYTPFCHVIVGSMAYIVGSMTYIAITSHDILEELRKLNERKD